MNRYFLVLQIFICVNCFAQKTAKEIYEENNSKVVYIETYDDKKKINGSGSGFIADDDGLIVTNFHVIEDAYYAKIFYYDGTESNVNMLYAYDEEWDLAALKTTPSFVKYVTIENYDKVEIGSVCFAIGSPRGIANTISDGIVSNKLTYKSGYIYQITSPISPGSSGGALFNEYGKLIGVTTSYRPDGQNLNYAIPSEYVADLIDGPFVPVSLPNFQKKYKKPTSYPEKRPIEKQPIEKKPNEEIIKPDIVENELQENTAIGFTPNSYSLSTGFNFYTSSVTNNFPSFIEFEKAFNFSFSYLFNNYSGVGITYQKNFLKNQNTNKNINHNFYKIDFLFRTSEKNFRVLLGFGGGLAYSQLRSNSDGSNSNRDIIIVDSASKNQFVGTLIGGIEYRFLQNFSIDIKAPFDFIFLSENNFYVMTTPGVGLSVMF